MQEKQVKCLNSKGGRGGVDGLQPSLQDRVFDTSGISFAMTTSFQPKIVVVGKMDGTQDHTHDITNRIYDSDGICPTIPTSSGGGITPKIIENCVLTGKENKECLSRAEQSRAEQSSCLIRQATTDGCIEIDVPGVADLSYPTSKTRRGRVIEKWKVSPTLTTTSIPSVLERWTWEIDGEKYLIRIRKLTPLECFSFMGCTIDEFRKAESVNSNTQLYKQAGNSIVVDVLAAIFKNLNLSGDSLINGGGEE